MKTSHKSRKKMEQVPLQNHCRAKWVVFSFYCFFCFTSSNFYFVETIGVQSGTPAPAREVPGPFHFLVEICGNDHRDQNQSAVFSCKHQTEINALWSFQGICHSFAIKAIYFQHSQKSPKITKQKSMHFAVSRYLPWCALEWKQLWELLAKTCQNHSKIS